MDKLVDLFCHIDDFQGFYASKAKITAKKWGKKSEPTKPHVAQ